MFARLIDVIQGHAVLIGIVLGVLGLLATRSGRKLLRDSYERGRQLSPSKSEHDTTDERPDQDESPPQVESPKSSTPSYPRRGGR